MSSIPHHIAIIPDGNRRWAREHGLPAFEGHRRGFQAARKIVKYARDVGIHTLTLWAFSTENWERTKNEVSYLMKLYAEMTDKFLHEAKEHEVRIIHLGRKDRIPEFLLKKVENAEKQTQKFEKNVLNVALDYGGRDEIIRAIKKLRNLKFEIGNLTEENFPQFLDTAGQPYPNPDLVIRTSGEMRTSGGMMWHAAYSELLFINKHFPDMTTADIDDAISEFAKRQRRFGK